MTTQIRNLALEPHPFGEIISGALIAAGLAAFGWLLRMAMRETLDGLRSSLHDLKRSVDNLSSRLDAHSERLSEHDSRLAVAEDRISRMGN